MKMYPRIYKPMLSLPAIECSNLNAMDQRWVSYSRRNSQLRWSTVWTKYWWEQNSFKLVVSDSSANIQTTFNPNHNYELAMVNLETYYSFSNIWGDNNSFKWSVDGGKTWTILHIPRMLWTKGYKCWNYTYTWK